LSVAQGSRIAAAFAMPFYDADMVSGLRELGAACHAIGHFVTLVGKMSECPNQALGFARDVAVVLRAERDSFFRR